MTFFLKMVQIKAEVDMIKRPFELPQAKYRVWRQVGERLGATTQSIVSIILGDESGKTSLISAGLPPDIEKIVRDIGASNGVEFP